MRLVNKPTTPKTLGGNKKCCGIGIYPTEFDTNLGQETLALHEQGWT